MQEFKNLIDALEEIQALETLEQKEARLKSLKRNILKLEIAVVVIGLIALSLIVLPFFEILAFSAPIVLAIVGGILMIVKAFKDGEALETEKFFLLISISNDKKQQEDGK